MQIIRYRDPADGAVRIGLADGDRVAPLAVPSMAELLRGGVEGLRRVCADAGPARLDLAGLTVLAPVDGYTEVWAAGVTYQRSRQARVAESAQSADVYDRVYDAERPELFFKSTAWRVVPHGA